MYMSFIATLTPIIGAWWMGSFMFFNSLSGVLYAFGKLMGLLAVYFILLQFILMGRAIWLEKTFGLDKLARLHKLNGYLSILFILVHPIFLIFSYGMDAKKSFIEQFLDFFYNYEDISSATFAVLIFISIVFFSIYIVRKHLKYETWYYIHLLTYLGVLLAFGHQLELGSDFFTTPWLVYYWYALYIFVFGTLLLFRFLKPLYQFYRQGFFVSDVVRETSDTTSIYIQGKNLNTLKAEAGQFFIVRFLAKGYWWQAHPFSLSWIPKNNRLRITAKNCGDFTATLSALPKETKVIIEGPFGIFTAPQKISNKKFLFIAGGVGITPIRSLLEKLCATNDVILLYSNKTAKDIIFLEELQKLADLHPFPIHHIMSNQPDFSGEKGRVDAEKIQRLVQDIKAREIYICGPPAMIESLNTLLKKTLNIPAKQIHFEIFSF